MMRTIRMTTPYAVAWSLLVSLLLSVAWAQQVEVVYSFGKIERLQPASDQWEFVKKGMLLQTEDLVRTPPISILRLRTAEGRLLPVLTGAQEKRVQQLVDEALRKLQRRYHPRIADPLQGEAPIDVIPTASAVRVNASTPSVRTPWLVDETTLESLQRATGEIPSELRERAERWLAQLPPPAYGSRQLQIVRTFYRRVFDLPEIPFSETVVRQYVQLLRAAGIAVELSRTSRGELLVSADTTLPPDQVRRITANAGLTKPQGDHLWLPMLIAPSTSFVEAWYHGAKADRGMASAGEDAPSSGEAVQRR